MSRIELNLDNPEFSEIRLLTFPLEHNSESFLFAINTHKVKEVIEYGNVSPLPAIYHPYISVLDLRGVPIPILDIQYVFGGTESSKEDRPDRKRIVVCEILNRLIGVSTGSQISIREFQDVEIKPPEFLTHKIQTQFINGVVKSGDSFIYMINLEEVLDSIAPKEASSKKMKTKRFESKRALVVEDSRIFRKKLAQLLEEMGFSVTLANDGVEGLLALEKDSAYDVVMTDIEMPQLNGIEMVRKIKLNAKWSEIPIIFHSSISNRGLISQIESENLGTYMVKFKDGLIEDTLEKLLLS